MKVGILTGGGDCPGLNAVIRAVARRSIAAGHEVVGVRAGWRGLVDGVFEPLGPREISGLLPRGGTILGTSRTNPYKVDGGVDAVLENFAAEGLDALVAIGGEDTLGVAARLHAEHELPGRRRPEDDRQRPLGDRLHVRLRHRRLDLHRGDRPAAHDRRVAQPRDGRRGDGPPHRLDRGHERHRRRRRRDPDPRASDHGRGGVRRASAGGTSAARTSRSSSSARATSCEGGSAGRQASVDEFGHVRLSARRRRRAGAARSRSAPATRRA